MYTFIKTVINTRIMPQHSQNEEEMSRYIDLEAYHQHERTHPYYEEMLTVIINEVKKRVKQNQNNTIKILELGAGTGIVTLELAKLNSTDITAVELDHNCCTLLQKIVFPFKNVKIVQGDMITYCNENKFDIIISVFSHDHVHYDKRFAFAENINKNLKSSGIYIMGNELIHEFTSEEERKKSLHLYHDFIIEMAKNEGNHEIAKLESEALCSGLNKIGDFKRHEQMLEEEMQHAGFTILVKEKIGPKDKDIGGVFVYIFEK